MPRLKPDTQRARREHILDAAELCFARAGFHRCTMQDICREAGVSPGALYVYFSSKEALIAGMVERDRAGFAARFAQMPIEGDVVEALQTLANHYFLEQPPHKQLMCVEIGVESTRNPQVAEIYRSVDQYVSSSFEALFERLKAEGRINPQLDIAALTSVFEVLGDGLFWRRATDPNFDAARTIPAVMSTIAALLNPNDAVPAASQRPAATREARQ
jgi:TetR/AcrR family transcriptional repressor of uid operon